MLCWKCDVCGKIGESVTSSTQFAVKPRGWRERLGRVPAGKIVGDICVYACSKECGDRYDRAEVEQVGLLWHVSAGNVEGDAKRKPHKAGSGERPLKVTR